jgi:ribosomal protein L18E
MLMVMVISLQHSEVETSTRKKKRIEIYAIEYAKANNAILVVAKLIDCT